MLYVLFVEIKNKSILNKSMVHFWQNDHDSLYIAYVVQSYIDYAYLSMYMTVAYHSFQSWKLATLDVYEPGLHLYEVEISSGSFFCSVSNSARRN